MCSDVNLHQRWIAERAKGEKDIDLEGVDPPIAYRRLHHLNDVLGALGG